MRRDSALGPMMAEDIRQGQLRAASIENSPGTLAARLEAEEATRQGAEDDLRRKDAELREFLEGATIGMHWVGPDGRILWANRAELDLLGYAREEFVGRHVAEFHVDRAVIDDILSRLARKEELHGFEARLRCKDGSIKHVILHSNGLWDRDRLIHTRCFTQDITDRKRAEVVQARLAAIVESSDDAIVSKTLDGIITSWNQGAERLFGYPESEVVGRSIMILIPPERQDEERMILDRLRRGERIQHFETVRVTRDGQPIHVSLSVSPVRDGTGRIIGASKIARDITERRRIEDALREQDRRKDDFLALLAHELRNPLAPLRNGLQMMRLAERDPDVAAQARAMMERQLGHMVRLIDDLLDISRINRNKMELRRSRVLLADALHSAVETARPMITAAGHSLAVRIPDEPIYLDADLTRLSQVFGNLLSNSAKYTARGGHIELGAECECDKVVVSIRDDGIGIPASEMQNIFQMFSQVDRSIERTAGGLGIGLELVKGLVEMHGGTVKAHSAGVGKGSTFTVSLPIILTPPEPSVDETPTADRPANGAIRRVLVVDDSEDGARSMARVLKLRGHDVRLAYDGQSAVDAASEFRPDLILMDVGMPGLNGYEATRQIREQAWARSTIVIALTGWGQEADRQLSREAGCDAHLVKPVSLVDLEQLVSDLAEARRRARS
jgi:PAS domain S-box-containing protein